MGCAAAQDANGTDLTIQDYSIDEVSPDGEPLEAEISGNLDDSGNGVEASATENASSQSKLAASNNDKALGIIPHGNSFVAIQEAIDNAGDEGVTLESITYYGNGNPISIYKSITINGNGAVLDAQSRSRIFEVTAGNVVIKNIIFKKGYCENDGGALYWNGESGNLINCSFTDNKAQQCGGAVHWAGESGNLTNCTFTKNVALFRHGGAIYWDGMAFNGNLANCSFTNNNAGISGGAVDWYGDFGNLTNCTFTSNYAIEGGAVLWSGKSGNLENCNFTHNHADEDEGGAVLWSGESGNLADCNFTGNSALQDDGGAVSWWESSGNLNCCTFTSNRANGNGGAVFWYGYNGAVLECKFTDNTAVENGGAIYWDNFGNDGQVNQSVFNHNFASSGGAVFLNCASGSLTDCNFTANNADYRAGAVYWNGASGSLTDCNFTGNKATDDGGAVFWDAPSGYLAACNFTANSAGDDGGAVYWNESAHNGYLANCNFTANNADYRAGAVYWNGNYGNLTNCNFIDNEAKNFGAVYWIGANGTLTDSNFTGNNAILCGAVGWSARGPGNLSGCTFMDNNATEKGGALYWDSKLGYLANSTFIGNNATEGGAVYWWAADGHITNACHFENNKASEDGGAVYVRRSNTKISDNCKFINNSAKSGGAIYWLGENGNLSSCYFAGNTVSDANDFAYGGAVYWEGREGTLSDCNFTGNDAPYGGAVHWEGKSGNMTGCDFTSNVAFNGGAVHWFGDYGIITSCNFTDNSAFNGDNQACGGAVYWWADYSNITGCVFTGNEALYGGAVYYNRLTSGKNYTISNCNFTNNSAEDGGAIYWKGIDGKLIESIFDNNTANKSGGAVYWSGDNAAVLECVFINNSNLEGKGGAIFFDLSNIGHVVAFSNFENNSAKYGGAIYSYQTYENITYSNFTANSAGQDGGAIYATSNWDTDVLNIIDATFESNTAVINGGAIYSDQNTCIDSAYFNGNNATKGSAIYKPTVYYSNNEKNLTIQNTEFGRNRADSYDIGIYYGGDSYASAEGIVIVYLGAFDNIANAIWNDGDRKNVFLKNITCEFSQDGNGRAPHTFNEDSLTNPTNGFVDDSTIWQCEDSYYSADVDAQLIDILIIKDGTEVIYNLTDGKVCSQSNKRGTHSALPDDSGFIVTDTDGKISIVLENLDVGTYTVMAVHKGDAYYTEARNTESFDIYDFDVTKTTDDVLVAVGENVTYNITISNNGREYIGGVSIDDMLVHSDAFDLVEDSLNTTWNFSKDHWSYDEDNHYWHSPYFDGISSDELGNWTYEEIEFKINNERWDGPVVNMPQVLRASAVDYMRSFIPPYCSVTFTFTVIAKKVGKYNNLIRVSTGSTKEIEVNSANETVVVPAILNINKTAGANETGIQSSVNYTIVVNNTSLVNITVFNMTVSGKDVTYYFGDDADKIYTFNGTKSFVIYGINATYAITEDGITFSVNPGDSISYMVQKEDGTNVTSIAYGHEVL